MSAVRDVTQGRRAGVAFEVERVEWPSADRLQLTGRWFGVRGRRFMRPTLDVEVDGVPRRLLAVLDHKPWAVEDGEPWVAAFAWKGEPVDLAGSELAVGSDLTVELRPPGEKRPPEPQVARRPRADLLESELATLRSEARRLARELHSARAEHTAEIGRKTTELDAELERVRTERAAAERDAEHRLASMRVELDAERGRVEQLEGSMREVRHELAIARADLTAQREELERERASIAASASQNADAEAEKLRAERDAARRESAKARGERDAARREAAKARADRDTAFRDRDRAKQPRPVAARVAPPIDDEAPPVPAAPVDVAPTVSWPPESRRGSQWAARIAALVALILVVAVLALLFL